MSEKLRWSDLTKRPVAKDLGFTLAMLGICAYAGGYFYSAGRTASVAISLFGVLVWMVRLKLVELDAREMRTGVMD